MENCGSSKTYVASSKKINKKSKIWFYSIYRLFDTIVQEKLE